MSRRWIEMKYRFLYWLQKHGVFVETNPYVTDWCMNLLRQKGYIVIDWRRNK